MFCQNVCPKFDLSNMGNIHKRGYSFWPRELQFSGTNYGGLIKFFVISFLPELHFMYSAIVMAQ